MKLPYSEVEFNASGAIVNQAQVDAAKRLIADEKATDVIVISHGWNNTPDAARALYDQLIGSAVAVRPKVAGAKSAKLVVVGVIWPSILWAPPDSDGEGAGAMSAADAVAADVTRLVQDKATRSKLLALVPALDTSEAARREFVDLARSSLGKHAVDDDDPDSAPSVLRDADAQTLLDAAAGSIHEDAAPAETGGAAVVDPMGMGAVDAGTVDGVGAGLDFGDVLGAVRNVLNTATYYTMKDRAGTVGSKGIAKLLNLLHTASPKTRLHLVGHSFGGRAVTAAALATSAPVSSVSLLQAAYSHFGMAQGWDGAAKNGVFWKVPAKVDGPIIVTYTQNDKAVGLAYAVASRIAHQIGAGLGDATDKYGGIGRNGALKTPASTAAQDLQPVGGTYKLKPHGVSSLKADKFIANHGDVAGREVAYAVLSAVFA